MVLLDDALWVLSKAVNVREEVGDNDVECLLFVYRECLRLELSKIGGEPDLLRCTRFSLKIKELESRLKGDGDEC